MNIYREAFSNIKTFPKEFWTVVTATLLNQAGNMACVFLVLYVTQHLGLGVSQGAAAFAVVSGSMLISGLLSGNLIDRFGASRIMSWAVSLNGLVLFTIPLIHNFFALIGMCLLWGLVYGVYRPASQTLVGDLSPKGLQKITFSIYRLASNLGMSLGPAIGGYLALHSFPALFIANGTANILAGILLLVGLSKYPRLKDTSPTNEKKIFSLKWLKQDFALRWFLIGVIPVNMVFFQHESTLSVYLTEDLHLPVSLYGWLFTLNTLMIVFFELLLNIATINWSYRVNFILGSAFITAGFVGIYFATTMWDIIFLSATWTVGEMILFPAASSYIAEIAPEGRRGSYMSLFATATNVGLLLGPLMGAAVMQQFGGHVLWGLCGVWGMLSIWIFARFRRV